MQKSPPDAVRRTNTMINASGTWSLTAFYKTKTGKSAILHRLVLSHGGVQPLGGQWHRLRLVCHGTHITAMLDGRILASDSIAKVPHSAAHGMAGLATGWNNAWFKNFSVTALQSQQP